MNWYNNYIIAQKITNNPSSVGINYGDIGHSAYNKNNPALSKVFPERQGVKDEQIWTWYADTGKFLVYPAGKYMTHNNVTGPNRNVYTGRYENNSGNKRVSVKGPTTQLPEELIEELKLEFGNDINIYVFH